MSSPMDGWKKETVEVIIGTILRTAVIIAGAVVLVGGILYLTHNAGNAPEYRQFRGEPAELRSVSGIVGEAASLGWRGIIQLGVLLLIATPISRVAFSVVAFVFQRDRTYIIVTLLVLAVLMYSLLWGRL
jgi:uncharacterized membrane protein